MVINMLTQRNKARVGIEVREKIPYLFDYKFYYKQIIINHSR